MLNHPCTKLDSAAVYVFPSVGSITYRMGVWAGGTGLGWVCVAQGCLEGDISGCRGEKDEEDECKEI